MINRGGVFAALRTLMLQTIPTGSKCVFNCSVTIGDWLERGAFNVMQCTDHSASLEVSHIDYAGATLAEIENLLNHSLEHIQELACTFHDPRLRSAAWATVTAYYLGFFSASAVLRLVGRPIVFLTRERLLSLQAMTGSASCPRQGAFRLNTGKEISATYIELQLARTQKLHEATWKSVLGLLKALKDDPAIVHAPEEADFYDSLCSHMFFAHGIGFDWPSSVRNQANYRLGFVYRLSKPDFRINHFLEPWRFATDDDLFRLIRATFLRCSARRGSFGRHVEMMTNVSIILYLIARYLYMELYERGMTDRRWEQQRRDYKNKMVIAKDEFPCLTL